MAGLTRWWVGGTGTWDSSTTTHWAASSNGSSGASVPGAGDTVIFDSNSGGGTCTKAATGLTVGALDMTGSSTTINWSSRAMICDTGDWKMLASACSGNVSLTFNNSANQTLTTDGYTGITAITRGGAAGTTQKLILADNLTMTSGTFTLSRAVLDMNGKNIQCATFTAGSGAITRKLDFNGSGTLFCTTFTGDSGTGFTITPSSGTIENIGAAASYRFGTGQTAPAVVYDDATYTLGNSLTLAGAGSCASVYARNGDLDFGSDFTISGALSVLADPTVNTALPQTVGSTVGGTARTVTVGGPVYISPYMKITDITAAGGAGPWFVWWVQAPSGNTNVYSTGPSMSALMGVG